MLYIGARAIIAHAPKMPNILPYRHLFFLYIWQESAEAQVGQTTWRYRLEDPITHAQHLFRGLEPLVRFLQSREHATLEGAENSQPEISGTERQLD